MRSSAASLVMRMALALAQPAALSAWMAQPSPACMAGGFTRGRSSMCRASLQAPIPLGRARRSLRRDASSGSRSMAMQAKSLDLPSKLKAVLWDMDGTLSDSESVHYLAYKTVFERDFPDMSFNPLTKEYYTANFQGKSKTDSMLRVFPDASDDERFKVAKDLEGAFEELSHTQLKPLPGLLPLLDTLNASGVSHAIVTNAPATEMHHSLGVLKVKQRFTHLVPSEECTAGKPDPEPYLEGMRRLGVKAGEAIAVEDSPAGIRSAVAAGLLTVGVMTSRGEEELKGYGASICIADYNDEKLLECISKWAGK